MQIDSEKNSEFAESLYSAVLGLLMFWAFVHTVWTRTLRDIGLHSFYIAIPICVLLFIIFISQFILGRSRPTTGGVPVVIFPLTPVFAFMAGLLLFAMWVGAKDLLHWLATPSLNKSFWLAALTVLATLACGSMLFLFRLFFPSLYGVTEAMVGVIVALSKVNVTPSGVSALDSSVYLAILTAGVYLIVRGLDNIHRGLTKAPYDPIGVVLLNWIKTLYFQQDGAFSGIRADSGQPGLAD
jgi:hypothetical protein